MTHDSCRDLLIDLAYGELDRRAAARVEDHLAGCPECRAERARLGATRRTMQALTPAQPDAAGERILLAAARRAAEAQAATRQRFLLGWLWKLSATAAAVLLVGGASYWILWPQRPLRADRASAVDEHAGPYSQRANSLPPPPVANEKPAAPPSGALLAMKAPEPAVKASPVMGKPAPPASAGVKRRSPAAIREWRSMVNSIKIPSVTSGEGVLSIIVTPWATVSVNGTSLGDAPVELRVVEGAYKIKVVYQGESREAWVKVVAGKRSTWSYTFPTK